MSFLMGTPWVKQSQQVSHGKENSYLIAVLPEGLKWPPKDGSLGLDMHEESSYPVTGDFEGNHHHVCCYPDSGTATMLLQREGP